MSQPTLLQPLASALAAACARHGPRPALTAADTVLSYSTLWQQACQLADAMRRFAQQPLVDQPVMVRCSNHPTDFVALLAVWIAGALVVPVHRSAPAAVVAAVQAKAACLLSIDLLAGPDAGATHENAHENAHGFPGHRLEVAAAPSAQQQRLLKDGALIIFTSGSTGQPKGVVLSHRAFHAKLQQNQQLFQTGPQTTTLLVLNNTFSFGIWVALMTLLQGGKVVVVERFAAPDFIDQLCRERVSFLGVVPTMIRALLAAQSEAGLAQARLRLQRSGCLRQVVTGGEPLGQALSAQWRAFIAPAELYDIYGLTETSTSDFVLLPQDHAAHPASIGRPFPGIRWRLADGELQLSTPWIMAGYCGDESLTAAAFDDGWFRTGDLATVDDDGFVQIVGRLKELIVRGGNKIPPAEPETALLQCPGVANALVTGMPDPVLGQRIHALLVAQPAATLDARSLRQALMTKLEKFKIPDVFWLADQLPAGNTGKASRALLQQWIADGRLQPLAG